MALQEIPGLSNPLDLFKKIGFDDVNSVMLSEYWSARGGDAKVHYFPFMNQSIIGAFLGDNAIALNSKAGMSKEFLLFILLHERRHLEQHRDLDFNHVYFYPVQKGDMDLFLSGYIKTEKEANDYALREMIELGFYEFVSKFEGSLRSNETIGESVFKTISDDMCKTGSLSFQDLIRSQLIPSS